MSEVKTKISYGYKDLIEIFATANNLKIQCIPNGQHMNIIYENDSDTAMAITMLSCRHLGFENMLVDYLLRCGCDIRLISIGKSTVDRDMNMLDDDWIKHRTQLGFR